jgi:hypothetical protein
MDQFYSFTQSNLGNGIKSYQGKRKTACFKSRNNLFASNLALKSSYPLVIGTRNGSSL